MVRVNDRYVLSGRNGAVPGGHCSSSSDYNQRMCPAVVGIHQGSSLAPRRMVVPLPPLNRSKPDVVSNISKPLCHQMPK